MIARIVGGLLIAGYTVVSFGGFDFGSHEKTELSPSMRQSPGGYRTWSFWHSGVSGGK